PGGRGESPGNIFTLKNKGNSFNSMTGLGCDWFLKNNSNTSHDRPPVHQETGVSESTLFHVSSGFLGL
ncbi:MAG TPA: hypothetical protein VJ350_04980, partial [Methanoregula sp.]|nr:hypothetical protein [Methanoregula sp.]